MLNDDCVNYFWGLKIFAKLDKLFHTSNLKRMISATPAEDVDELLWFLLREADERLANPVTGCGGIIERLQEEVTSLNLQIQQLKERKDGLMVVDGTKAIEPKRATSLERSHVPDNILENIIRHASARPLRVLKAASRHLDEMIPDSSIKLHRKLLISDPFLYALDHNNVYSIVELPLPFRNQGWKNAVIVGTLKGLVVLALERGDDSQLILYNPLTLEAVRLPDQPPSCCVSARKQHTYGFGYGNASPNDPKVVIGYDQQHCECSDRKDRNSGYWHVLSLKTELWTTPETDFPCANFYEDVGVFLGGCLYWISFYPKLRTVMLDVEEMKLSRKLDVPDGTHRLLSRLGTLDGCLCMVLRMNSGFDVWVLLNGPLFRAWTKRYSFSAGIEYDCFRLNTVCILEDGRIVVKDSKSHHVIFYDPSNGSHVVSKCDTRMVSIPSGIEYDENLKSISKLVSKD